MIEEKLVKVAGGAGGPKNDSIPVYGDDKAPNGDWAYMPDGIHQLMFQNGQKLVIVNPLEATQEERNKFFTYKADGKISYSRVWYEDDDEVERWVEYSKLVSVDEVVDPEPDPDPDDGVIKFRLKRISFDDGIIVEVENVA